MMDITTVGIAKAATTGAGIMKAENVTSED